MTTTFGSIVGKPLNFFGFNILGISLVFLLRKFDSSLKPANFELIADLARVLLYHQNISVRLLFPDIFRVPYQPPE